MKKKYFIILSVALLLAVAAIGGTLASGYVESKELLQAPFSEKTLSVAIVDEENEVIKEDLTSGTALVPGGAVSLNRSITNSEEDGYDIYARVNIYYDWKLQEDKMDEDRRDEDVFQLLLQNQALFVNTSYENAVSNGDWIIVESIPGQIVMYYTKPIKSGEKVCFLDQITFDADMDNVYAGASLELIYEVDAVQAGNRNVEVAQKAISAEWGVFATIENGTIIAISETRKVEE